MLLSTDVVDTDILINESQLGSKLSESIHSFRRSDFSLMLAMLTEDVRAHGQFLLPKSSTVKPISNDEQLRKSFHLPKKSTLALDDIADISGFNQSSLIIDDSLSDIKLKNALAPQPIAFRDDKKHIPNDVFTNTSVYCQAKYNQVKESDSDNLSQRLTFNANLWLDAVKTTMQQAPLASA